MRGDYVEKRGYVRRMKAVVLDDSCRALAQPVRRDLLRLISDGERPVGELVDGTRLAELRSFLDQFWTDELDALRRVAEEEDS